MMNQNNTNAYHAKALRSFWQAQNSQLHMLEDFVENGGTLSDEVNAMTDQNQKTGLAALHKLLAAQDAMLHQLPRPHAAAPAVQQTATDGENAVLRAIDLADPTAIKRFEMQLQPCEATDQAESLLPQQGTILLVAGKQDAYVTCLQQYLTQKGLQTVLLCDLPEEEAQAKQQLAPYAATLCGMFLVANAHYDDGKDPRYERFLLSAFYLIKHGTIAIRESKRQDALFLFTTFLDGALGTTGTSEEYAYGGLNGIAKTLSIECKGMAVVKLVDFVPDIDTGSYLAFLERELRIHDVYAEVCCTKDATRCYLGTQLTPYTPCKPACPITAEDVIVVSGGSRGVTSACILALAQSTRCTFVILGRAELTDENRDDAQTCQISELKEMKTLLARRWKAAGIREPIAKIETKAKAILAQREMEKTFAEIRATGNPVVYYACDVNDAAQTKAVMETIQREVGKVTGIVHGAGIVSDAKIWNKDITQFKRVFRTKYSGLNHLTDAVDLHALKLLVMFSSVSGYFGNDGQVDYAAGNDYLDKCAYYYRTKYPQCRALAFNWGAWDGGVMDALYRKVLSARGFVLIPLQVGAQYFANEFHSGLPSAQVMISNAARPQI